MTQRYNTLKRDAYILNEIHRHKGIDNCISAERLCRILEHKHMRVNKRSIKGIITKIKYAYGIPICYKRGKGYYYPQCAEDLTYTIKDLQSMITALTKHVTFLESFYNIV